MSRIFSPQQFVALTFSMAFNFVLGKEIANELIGIHRFATEYCISIYCFFISTIFPPTTVDTVHIFLYIYTA